MMRLPMIWAIARAEIRSTRRLTRYWVFAVLSVLLAFLFYMQYAAIHGFASNISATVGAMGPRYLISSMGIYLLIIFLLGLIFLAFDIRARDVRERMAEVLDSRPVSNAELLVGRSLGLVIMAWLPVLFTAGLLQTFGSIALLFDWPLGEPVEPYSLLGFTLDALVAFVLWCSVIVLLAVLLKNRLLVVFAALVLFALQVWGFLQLPLYLQPTLSLISSFFSSSDLVPVILPAGGLSQTLAMLTLAAGLMALAAALHPRRDSAVKSRTLLLGGGLVVLAGLTIGTLTWQAIADVEREVSSLAAHLERSTEPRVDLSKISGSVIIDPGDRLELDLKIRAQTPANEVLDTILFTFNPGLRVEALTVNGEMASWRHEFGLLDITPPSALTADSSIVIDLKASGTPNTTFGYLDSARNLLRGTSTGAQLGLLGVDVSVFSADYVALMPGSRWLPSPGTDVPNDDARTHPVDFFEIDLAVTIPPAWQVAGPGRRQPIAENNDRAADGDPAVYGGRAHYRFAPAAVVPMVGLITAHFERRAMNVSGVEFELLLHPGHDRNLRFFDDITDELATYLADLIDNARRLGVPYPYAGFSLVETPNNLRGYGGGWRMDTAQSLPGMMLVRESSFPTARFGPGFNDPERFEELDGGIARAKIQAIERFFENDVSGGNLFLGGSRNFLLYQTSSRGEGALAMNFVLDELMNRLLMDKEGFFSAHMFDQQSGFMVGQTITNMASGQGGSVAQSIQNAVTDRPSVWDLALGTALADLDPASDPKQTLNVLALKSRAIARSIIDGIGREKTGALVAQLLERYRGENFEVADLERIATELDIDLQSLIGDWLHESALPGFVTSPVTVERLADDRWGEPVYQTRLHIRNDEPTPGLVLFTYKAKANMKDSNFVSLGENNQGDKLEPLRIAGNQSLEVGILTSSPVYELWLRPYLALNRHDIQLTIPSFDAVEQMPAEPFVGGRASAWRPARTGDIIIDDLDAGFSVVNSGSENASGVGGGPFFVFGNSQIDMDQGLPEAITFFGAPPVWSRRESATSFGKYRHTIAMVRRGTGEQRAIFTATLPRADKWRLAYHLPVESNLSLNINIGPGGARARVRSINNAKTKSRVSHSYDLRLVTDTEIRPLEFDGAAAESGWNTLGDFDLPAGTVRVEVSDAISAGDVIADAIRWRPLTLATQQQAQR
jgi:ABC-type transport system involved in multi-copper enzyme maturation permease subunit